MPLDSDVDNPDSQLHVEFYEYNNTRQKDDPWNGKTFIRIMVPGDKTNVIEAPVREHHKARFPRQWLHWQMRNSEDLGIETTLDKWHQERPDELTEFQKVEFQMLKFRTVEQIATASDAQLQRVGMGAHAARTLAQAYLKRRNAGAAASQADDLADLKRQNEEMRAQLAALMADRNVSAAVTPKAPTKNKGGRPRKVHVRHDAAATGSASHQ